MSDFALQNSPVRRLLELFGQLLGEIPAVMTKRMTRVLATAAGHGVRRFILGAWGCGAFGLDAEMMARIFRKALAGPFRNVFDDIVFAVTDWSPDQRFIGPFRRAFDPSRPF